MQPITFPNVRKLFIPDPGHLIFDCDLSGADAQVVAWEADDPSLKETFRAGLNIHQKNISDMWGRAYRPADKTEVVKGHNYTPYDEIKRAVHATNYGGSSRTVASTLGWTTHEADQFQSRWFSIHPNIKDWHRSVEHAIQTTRRVTNKFGYRRIYFDRPDGLLPQALAWIPQSTIGLLCSKAAVTLNNELGPASPSPLLNILLQVHDSIVFQVARANVSPELLTRIRSILHQPVPYPDPLTIPWEISSSPTSWGDCKKINWGGSWPPEKET